MTQSAVPATPRERVRQALHVTGWMLKAIDAPKDLQYWPRRDREAWMDVIGRPKLRAVMHTMLTRQADAPVAPDDFTQTDAANVVQSLSDAANA